ncbi:MAG: hypothetical protein KGI83_02805 [Verrucomicrobiota bacterium]|nr:hypothetical protein [Verrucomicrobiota bacterium]
MTQEPLDRILHAQRKKELTDVRQELVALLNKLPNPPPKKGTPGYETYRQMQSQIQDLKAKLSKTHDEWMELLKAEDKLSKELGENKS